jgi:hypothetical protein
VFPVRYEQHLYIKSKGITVTGLGDLYCCEMLSIHIVWTIGSQMERLSASRIGRALLHTNTFLFSLVLISVTG